MAKAERITFVRLSDTREQESVSEAIREAGGRVRHRFGKVIVVEAPEDREPAIRAKLPPHAELRPTMPEMQGNSIEAIGLRALQLRRSEAFREAQENRPHKDREWGTGDLEEPDADDQEPARVRPGPEADQPVVQPHADATDAGATLDAGLPHFSERMINAVGVGIVCVGGTQASDEFSFADTVDAFASVQEGLDWLAGAEPAANMSWHYDLEVVGVDSVPWTGARWPGMPASFYRGIDAALLREDNGKIYFFKGSQYVRFSSVAGGVDAGYPKPIADGFKGLPANFQSGIDAALWRMSNGKIYLFKGPDYVRITDLAVGVEAGYPKKIATAWPGLPGEFQAGIDAALLRKDNGKIYFFKGNQYVRFSSVAGGVDAGYPKPIADGWKGLPAKFQEGISAALWRNSNSKIYLFKTNRITGQYVRITDVGQGVDAGYEDGMPIGLSTEESEALWRDKALNELGLPAGAAGLEAHAQAIRTELGTQWAYVALITKHVVNWFAYASSSLHRVTMEYDGGISPMVFAHETGHIFGAPDEYAASGCGCGGARGFFATAPNDNCANCAEGGGVPCVMKSNSQAVCVYTPRHFGWDPFTSKLDAGVWRGSNDRCYLFSEDQIVRYTDISAGRDSGYPQPITNFGGLPASFKTGIDAALWRKDNDALYFFKGSQYVRFSAGSNSVDAGYPKSIAANWPGLPASFQSGIDAAFWRGSNDAVYMFKGGQYVRFTKVPDGVDAGYPKSIAANWPGLPASFQSGIDAALERQDNDKIYFFKGKQYVRFTSVPAGVDAGYPNWININWMPFPK